jgi:hypothetical protein
MKTLLKLFVVGLALLTRGFGQEPNPKHTGVQQEPVKAFSEQALASGSNRGSVPVVQPKALPLLNPALGDVARKARAAHAAAPKAQMALEKDGVGKLQGESD